MSVDEHIGWTSPDECCLVCGKKVTEATRIGRVRWGNVLLSFCCPLCLQTYLDRPEPVQQKAAQMEYYRDLKRASSSPQHPEGPLNE